MKKDSEPEIESRKGSLAECHSKGLQNGVSAGNMKKIEFTKISATGNDFIVIDNRKGILDLYEDARFFSHICQRRVSFGADGVILLEKSRVANFRYAHVNVDGSIAEMCGNGSRAITYFARALGLIGNRANFEIHGHIYHATIEGRKVTTEFIPPSEMDINVPILEEPNMESGGYIVLGVPHFVIFVADADSANVTELGHKYRHHPFFPRGTNVNFVELSDRQTLCVRTFERGVEAETLACGTGAVAAAIIGHMRKQIDLPVRLIFKGGELTVDFKQDLSRITLTGFVTPVYRAQLL
jgi:diaminopimelate epimerase